MKYLELILRCLTALLRVIFPQHPPVPETTDATGAAPSPASPPLPPHAGDGGAASGDRRLADALPPPRSPSSPPPPGADWLGISGYTLLLAGCAGSQLKYRACERRWEFEDYYFLQAIRVCRDAYPLTFIKPSIPFVVIKEHITINYSRQTL